MDTPRRRQRSYSVLITFAYVNHGSSFPPSPDWMVWRRAVHRHIIRGLVWKIWLEWLEFSLGATLIINGLYRHALYFATRSSFDAILLHTGTTAVAWNVGPHLKWRSNMIVRRYVIVRLRMMHRVVVQVRRMWLYHIVR